MILPETAIPLTRRNTHNPIMNDIFNDLPAVPNPEPSRSASSSRLLSIAKYTSFHPYNIACSDPLFDSATISNDDNNLKDSDSHMMTSLGAVAGSMGIAIFRSSKPFVPIMVFSNYHHHHHHTTTSTPGITHPTTRESSRDYYLSFQPLAPTSTSVDNSSINNSNNSLFLASASGTGVLLWDVSGHTISPLWGRIRVDAFTTTSSSSEGTAIGTATCRKNRITSLGWKYTTTNSVVSIHPLLCATTVSTAFLWDIRMGRVSGTSSMSSSMSSHRPCLRFGTSGTSSRGNNNSSTANNRFQSHVVQMACSHINDECAVLDSVGVVRVYDPRMIGQSTTNSGRYCVDEFQAHNKLGAGIAFMPAATTSASIWDADSINNSWITWGLDNDSIVRTGDSNSSSIVPPKTWVKVWMKPNSATVNMNPSFDDTTINNTAASEDTKSFHIENRQLQQPQRSLSYQLVAEQKSNDSTVIACARVCPLINNTFITVGFNIRNNGNRDSNNTLDMSIPSWRADVWQLHLQTTQMIGGTDTNSEPGSEIPLKLNRLVSLNCDVPATSTDVGGTRMFMNKGFPVNKNLWSIIGENPQDGSGFGMICAAEIGYSSYQTIPTALANFIDTNQLTKNANQSSNLEQGLVLCCLSDKGYITTHAIPEASQSYSSQALKHKQRMAQTTTEFYQQQYQEMPSSRIWNNSTKNAAGNKLSTLTSSSEIDTGSYDSKQFEFKTNRDGSFAQSTKSATSMNYFNDPSTQSLTYLNESVGGNVGNMAMPFDMDLSYNANSIDETNNDALPKATSITPEGRQVGGSGDTKERSIDLDASQMFVYDEQETMERQRQKASALMARIETDRIPCPRLCGATFSPGVGGLAGFHNGNVKKLWKWWEKSYLFKLRGDSNRSGQTASASVISDPTSTECKKENAIEKDRTISHHNCPRTLKELTSMVAAAKEAYSTDIFFADSLSTSAGDVDELGGINKESDSTPGTTTEGPATNNASSASRFSSSAMNYVVQISFPDYSNIRGQELALKLKLGDITNGLQTRNVILDSEQSPTVIGISPTVASPYLPRISPATPATQPSTTSGHDVLLPHPSPYITRSQRKTTPEFFKTNVSYGMQQISVTGNIQSKLMANKSLADLDHERGVHAGEYSNSPTQQESLLFLRKFGKNQKDDIFIDNFIGNEALNQNTQHSSTRMKYIETSKSKSKQVVDTNILKVGVYALRAKVREEQLQSELIRFYVDAHGACKHNAVVCRTMGEIEKAEVWEVLADIVQTQLETSSYNDFDGWSTTMKSGSLGRGLIESFLRYYHSHGDVQMLATIVCILRSKLFHNQTKNKQSLLSDDDERYDTYIRRYADLLYGWGLLNIRAELCKHLIRPPTHPPEEVWQKANATTGKDNNTTDHSTPGIALVFRCSHCGGDTDFGTNYCRTCQDYALRCTICDMSVRGLFTVCDLCGHGGHIQHLKDWFALSKACPTGCGCNCIINSLAASRLNYIIPAYATQSETLTSGIFA